MAKNFTCPTCSALYQVVKAEAGPETTNDPKVMCWICGAPLPAREDQWIVKYFLLRTLGDWADWHCRLAKFIILAALGFGVAGFGAAFPQWLGPQPCSETSCAIGP